MTSTDKVTPRPCDHERTTPEGFYEPTLRRQCCDCGASLRVVEATAYNAFRREHEAGGRYIAAARAHALQPSVITGNNLYTALGDYEEAHDTAKEIIT